LLARRRQLAKCACHRHRRSTVAEIKLFAAKADEAGLCKGDTWRNDQVNALEPLRRSRRRCMKR